MHLRESCISQRAGRLYSLKSDMPQPDARREPKEIDEPPPFLGCWRNVYMAIVLYLATLIALFSLFTRSLNR